uniref:Immunoglobulin domain-containing protein n=1 Tax=Cyprinus carpio TaxID=7962 RepID=A0A8C1P882_CYPCA
MVCTFVLFWLCWWCLTGVFGESLSVMEGDSVTLHTDVTTIHEDDDILWKFGAEKSLIAQINRPNQFFPDERFRDRLKLDRQTGSLTITNITTQHTGRYELEINGKELSTKTFSVSVFAHLPVPNITRNFSQNLSSSSSSQQNCSLQLCDQQSHQQADHTSGHQQTLSDTFRSGPTFSVHSVAICCLISVDRSCSPDVLHLQEI